MKSKNENRSLSWRKGSGYTMKISFLEANSRIEIVVEKCSPYKVSLKDPQDYDFQRTRILRNSKTFKIGEETGVDSRAHIRKSTYLNRPLPRKR